MTICTINSHMCNTPIGIIQFLLCFLRLCLIGFYLYCCTLIIVCTLQFNNCLLCEYWFCCTLQRSIHLSIYPSIYLSIHLSIHVSIYLSIHLFINSTWRIIILIMILPCQVTTSHECALHTCSLQTPVSLELISWSRKGNNKSISVALSQLNRLLCPKVNSVQHITVWIFIGTKKPIFTKPSLKLKGFVCNQ